MADYTKKVREILSDNGLLHEKAKAITLFGIIRLQKEQHL